MSYRLRSASPWGLRLARMLLLALAAGSSGSGCSFLFTEGPSSEVRSGANLTCSQSPGWPLLDTAIAGFEGVRTAPALSKSDADYQGARLSRSQDIGFGVTFLALFGMSAVYGYTRVSACNAAIEEAAKPDWSEQLHRHRRPQPAFQRPLPPPSAIDPPPASPEGAVPPSVRPTAVPVMAPPAPPPAEPQPQQVPQLFPAE